MRIAGNHPQNATLRSKNYRLIIPLLTKRIPDRGKRKMHVDVLAFRNYTILVPYLTNKILLGRNLKKLGSKEKNNQVGEGRQRSHISYTSNQNW